MHRYQTIEVAAQGPVLHIRLNRPEVRNAFNGTVVSELQQAFAAASTEASVRVVVLSGNGKSFSAGADLAWMQEQAELPKERNQEGAERMARMFLSIARCSKPVVARIHGHALGGGTGLTAAVDLAFCTEDCLFGLTEVKLGIVPAVISPFVMQKIGVGRARALFLTGERFSGAEAQRIGLVQRAVPEAELDGQVQKAVDELLSAGPAAVASSKELIRAVGSLSLEDAIPVTSKWIAELRATPEAREGFSAFLGKRKPNWIG
ncbi:MAG: enoyl-CoA hydratase-related protein [Planctomycetes bacterium]|jgi:methylglutaconyl-CoA hydratase|nr:enoyl-CoA hydratase-related protein [Planctomycetota bacterium]